MSRPSVLSPVKAVVRIDRFIQPNTIFLPASAEQREELFALKAVEELSDAEVALSSAIRIQNYREIVR